MTIGSRFPLPPAMTPGAESVDGKVGAEGVLGNGRTVVLTAAESDGSVGESVRRNVSGNQFRPLKVEMASVRAALGLPAGDKVDAAVEADCATRNDALGGLFRRVFKWAPPPMVEGLKG